MSTAQKPWTVEIPELPKMLAEMRKLGATNSELNKTIRDGMKVGARKIRDTAKATAPKKQGKYPQSRLNRKPGTLRRNIRVVAKRRSRRGFGYVVTSGLPKKQLNTGDAYYGAFLEWGTKRITARPFLEPAYKKHREDVVNAIKNSVEQAFLKAFAR